IACADQIRGEVNRCHSDPGWLARLRDASCLAVVALLSCEAFSAVARTEALHDDASAASLRSSLESLLNPSEIPPWSSEAGLLFTLLLLRSQPAWLRETSSESPLRKLQALPLKAQAQGPATSGPRRLLVLRLIEELTLLDPKPSSCQEAVLRQVLADKGLWDLAGKEAAEGRASDEEVVADPAPNSDEEAMPSDEEKCEERPPGTCAFLPRAGDKDCLLRLHAVATARLCACLATR
ncbi:unnamed protein product, partial [Polarella glacialis]